MRRAKSELMQVEYSLQTMPIGQIICRRENTWDEKELRKIAAKFILEGAPAFSINACEDGFVLLSGEREYYACAYAGIKSVLAQVYRFEEVQAEIFTIAARIKEGECSAMDEAYAMKRLLDEYGCTQQTIAALTGKSRPAVANTLRLLTLSPEVVGMVESGSLSAGHARALVRIPQDKQYAFAQSVLAGKFTVRETEKAAQAFLGEKRKNARKGGSREELKALASRFREVFKTKVVLIGNEEKGKLVIEYYSADDLYRFEELLEQL